MGRSPRCSQEGLNKGAWTAIEDKTLIHYINTYGQGKWSNVSKITGLKRCGKSCRLRWMNYLRPDIKRGNISPDEEELILRLHKLLGNRWSLIAGRLPGRTDNEIKNYWNTNLAKKAQDNLLHSQIPTNNVVNGLEHHLVSMNPLEPVATSNDPSSEPMGPLLSSHVEANNLLLFSNGTVKSQSSDRSSSLTCGDAEDSVPNFMIDFNVDDIYNILDPGFVSSLNETLPEDEEEEDHRYDNANPGADMGSDFPSLATFLGSEEWLGDEVHVNVTSKDDQICL